MMVGSAELLSAALLLIPRLAAYGAGLFAVVMLGAIYTLDAQRICAVAIQHFTIGYGNHRHNRPPSGAEFIARTYVTAS